MPNRISSTKAVLLALVTVLCGGFHARAAEQTPTIVFVCEHGSVKSVMAALFFNRLAVDKKLSHRAVARGLTPDEKIPAAVAEALTKEGFAVTGFVPQRLGKEEGAAAAGVVGFCQVPLELAESSKTSVWLDVPPVSVDYEKAKAVMLPLVMKLARDLESTSARRP